tara:strand:+ start:41 stop:715 length:675 start_codon:yes stop_codon:yes gene_type:complete
MSLKAKVKYVFALLSLWMVLYYAIQAFIVQNHYDFLTPLDKLIPFIPEFVWIYHTMVPVLLITTIGLLKNKRVFFTTILASFIAILVLNTFYVLFPAFYPRNPLVEYNSISVWMVEITRQIDGASNTFPSGHVTFSWLMFLAACECQLLKKKKYYFVKGIYLLWAVGICISTLFLKQHFIIDVISGIIMAYVCFWTSRRILFKLQSKIKLQEDKLLIQNLGKEI